MPPNYSKSSTVQTSTPREALGPNWEPGTTEKEGLGSLLDQTKVPRDPWAAAGEAAKPAAQQG